MKSNTMLSIALLIAGAGCAVVMSQRRPAQRSIGDQRSRQKLLSSPQPVHVIEAQSVEAQAETRAFDHLDACSRARKRKDRVAAYAHLEGAKEEVRRHLKIDHYVNAELLNMWGCLKHDEGLDTDALHLWEGAASVASEWPTTCRGLIPVIRGNLRLVG